MDNLQKVQNEAEQFKNKVVALPAEKWWAMSCYIPIFNIVTCALAMVRMVNSRFCRFHGRQGFVLFGLWFLTIVVAVISPIASLMLWGVVIVLHIAGIVISFAGKETKIPVLGSIAAKIPEFYFFSLLTGQNPETEEERKDVQQTHPLQEQKPPTQSSNVVNQTPAASADQSSTAPADQNKQANPPAVNADSDRTQN